MKTLPTLKILSNDRPSRKKTQLMGILNCTPDSFFDGGNYFDADSAIKRGFQMIEEGVDILDIGGESTRPGAKPISLAEEMQRVYPVLKALCHYISVSIDTTKPKVAQMALDLGAFLVNDTSGCKDPDMLTLVKNARAKICIMHAQGTPEMMQLNPHYKKGVIQEILEWFEKKVDQLTKMGIEREQIILDPGIGFGKTKDDCLLILNHLSQFQQFGLDILIGLSRKSFMSKILEKPPQELLSTTLALNTMCLLQNVEIIRVHDVQEHRDVIDTVHHLREVACNPTLTSLSPSSKSSF